MRRKNEATRSWIAILAGVLAVLLAWPSVAWAGPAKGPEGPAPAPAPAEAAAETPTPGAGDPVADALEQGDLSEASEQATAARRSDPSAANWRREAEILEQQGDFEGAATAYRGELDALPKDDPGRERASADLHRVHEQARGRVKTEPASTHRDELDATWAAKKKQAAPKAKQPAAAAGKGPEDRIVRKWYFWVTVAAIVASAAAVTGIAIKASRDEKRDSLDQTRRPSITGPAILRF